ncbi:uncharacterized protein LOC116411538 [Xenopus tropicalis]|uniref:Uncharacterized protein LOC116411538 n=1 Tax=Xenopus tropicalis TaxID=8364 RepID=A0A8J1JPN6_XENTR|nr:uncharacterized protein LOC116411538 [Xenopus tropicalis]
MTLLGKVKVTPALKGTLGTIGRFFLCIIFIGLGLAATILRPPPTNLHSFTNSIGLISPFLLIAEGNNFFTDDDDDDGITIPPNPSVTTLPATTDDEEAYDDATEGSISVETTTQVHQENVDHGTESSRNVDHVTKGSISVETTTQVHQENVDHVTKGSISVETTTQVHQENVNDVTESSRKVDHVTESSRNVEDVTESSRNVNDVTESSRNVEKTADYGQEAKKDDTETSEATVDDQEKEANDARKSVEKTTTNVQSPVPASSALEMMEDLLEDLDLDNDRNVIIISTVAACGFLLVMCSLMYLALVISRLKHREKSNISQV